MHNRKTFLVYPPDYDPCSSPLIIRQQYKEYKSLGKAKKAAMKMGVGAIISCSIRSHRGKFTRWNSSSLVYICEVV